MARNPGHLVGGIATLAALLASAGVGSADAQRPNGEQALLNRSSVRVGSRADSGSFPIDGARALLNRSGERDVRLVPEAGINVASTLAEPVDGKRALLGVPAAVGVPTTRSLRR